MLLTIGAKESAMRPKDVEPIEARKTGTTLKPFNEQQRNMQKTSSLNTGDNHEIDMSAYDDDMIIMLPPPPPPQFPAEKVTVEPVVANEVTKPKPTTRTPNPSISARHFTIASLQEFTNSFSPENLIEEGMLGNIYRAELPDGKVCYLRRN